MNTKTNELTDNVLKLISKEVSSTDIINSITDYVSMNFKKYCSYYIDNDNHIGNIIYTIGYNPKSGFDVVRLSHEK